MFRKMRRGAQALDAQACREILHQGREGVLALRGEGGYPYAVPLNYVFDEDEDEGRIFFHCAIEGHKLDAIARCDKACFCVIAQAEVDPERYTTRFRSVVAFGRVRVLEEDDRKRVAIEKLACKYAPQDAPERRQEMIQGSYGRLAMLEMRIEHLTGKRSKDLP